MITGKVATNIWSEDEILKFYDKVICYDKDDRDSSNCDFFCVAARKKYLPESMKDVYDMGNTFMEHKNLLTRVDRDMYLAKVRQVNATLDFIPDKQYRCLPRECMVFYANVNHVDIFKSVHEFKMILLDWEYNALDLLKTYSDALKENINDRIKAVQSNLMKSFQDARNSTKAWLDIDCDIDENVYSLEKSLQISRLDILKKELKAKLGPTSVEPYIIWTRGGCHVLINRSSIRECNSRLSKECTSKEELTSKVVTPENLLEFIGDFFSGSKVKEIKVNPNAGVPMPGTVQGGFRVRLY